MSKYLHLSAITILVSLLLPSVAIAENNTMQLDTATEVITDYKALRKQCSSSKGELRKKCFNELSSSNDRYQVAKKIVRQNNEESEPKVHYLSLVN
ncbi:hypothetical protein SAMN02745866_02488 [Alteromonadaceae bacterium Bs31]|nr:hypothetical protein SAMN02745866_02488 [Alteromonadaceae bacterium Bs31]